MARDETPRPVRAGRRPPVSLAQLPSARAGPCRHRRCDNDRPTVLDAPGRAALGTCEHLPRPHRPRPARVGRRIGAAGHVRAQHRQPARLAASHLRPVLPRPPPALRCERPDGARAVPVPRRLVPARHPRRHVPPLLRADRRARGGIPPGAVRRRVRILGGARARVRAALRTLHPLDHAVLAGRRSCATSSTACSSSRQAPSSSTRCRNPGARAPGRPTRSGSGSPPRAPCSSPSSPC